MNQRYQHREANQRERTEFKFDKENYKMEIRLHSEPERHFATSSVYV